MGRVPPFASNVSVYCLGALQLAVVPPFTPLHDHVKLPVPEVTMVAFPVLHKLLLGAVILAWASELPQLPLIAVGVDFSISKSSIIKSQNENKDVWINKRIISKKTKNLNNILKN